MKNRNLIYTKIFKFDFLLFLLFSALIFYLYSNYINILTWGSDYAGYINLALAFSEGGISEYVESRTVLSYYTTTTTEPVYTPVGFPLLILATQLIHSWNVILIKLITPLICVGLFFLLIKIFSKNYEKIIIFVVMLNPFFIDQFRDITTELIALFFLLLGIYFSRFKNIYFFTAVLIRPSYFVFVIIYLFLNYLKKRNLNEIIYFVFGLFSIQIIFSLIFNINFYGLYLLTETGSTNFSWLFENLLNIDISRITFIIYEFGRLFTTISHPINTFVGVVLIFLLIFANNNYSYMSLGFLFFHIIWFHYDYVRFLLPLAVLVPISFLLKIRNMHLSNYLKNWILVFTFLLIIPYSLQINNQIDALTLQRGPYQSESQSLFKYINNNYNEGLFSFHSARVFTLFTKLESYKIDEEIIDDTIIICEFRKEQCKLPTNYKLVYENNLYKVFESKK